MLGLLLVLENETFWIVEFFSVFKMCRVFDWLSNSCCDSDKRVLGLFLASCPTFAGTYPRINSREVLGWESLCVEGHKSEMDTLFLVVFVSHCDIVCSSDRRRFFDAGQSNFFLNSIFCFVRSLIWLELQRWI